MKRRRALLVALAGICLGLAALGSQNRSGLLLLQWAAKAPPDQPPVAVLIELGLKDDQPTPWPGRASVSGAKVVHREGYRFRDGDKLVEPNAWQASTRRPGQGQAARNPARAALNRTGTVGVVLHLADIQPDAALTVDVNDKTKAVVPLREVLSGAPKFFLDGAGVVRRISTATPVVMAKTEDDFPAAAYGPDGTLWVAYISYTVKQEDRRVGGRQLPEQPANFQSFYTPEFGDQLFVKYYRAGQWSEPIAVTGPRQDLVRCAVAVDGQGRAWVGYSANRDGNYHLFVRAVRAGEGGQGGAAEPEQQLTRRPAPDLSPAMCTDQSGRVWLACQSWSEKGAGRIRLFTGKDGKWADGPALPELKSGGNCWYAALAAGPDGQVAVAYDVYSESDYDVHVAVIEGERVTDHPVATSGHFEARPAVAYDARGRLWIAYEEGPENWGKNFGALEKGKGNPLYNQRTVRLACLDNGKLFRPSAELPGGPQRPRQARERLAVYSYPKVGLDGQGRVWLCYRQKMAVRFGPGTAWLTVARRLDGDTWSEPIDLHHSDGLLDSRPVLLPHASGGLLVVHNTDGRYATPGQLDNQIYASVVALPGEAAEPKLVAAEPGNKDGRRAAEERAAVERIRGYRLEADGKKYQLIRGEFHRHTEISGDGGNDGSLEDMFRYAIDCAALDWIGNGDHDNGGGREYTWWLIQKYSDAYQVRNAFTPMFTYERSVPYPHGHRNCMFAKRGVRTLPRLAEPDPAKRVAGINANDTKMLYRYLHELDGICAVHTSATSMGTDWRDNDPVVEPLVEIYQGDRMSYEYEDAPRSGHDPKSNKLPTNIAGWFPDGFVINALKKKGYRLSFQSSSDHISTHISYCVALAERHDREGILAALKKRHSYGATDDIIVDVKSGPHMMGDEFKTDAAPALQIAVIGTKPLAQIDILKDSSVVETIKPGKPEYKGAWTDPKPTSGVHYYYVRVLQEDEELAWGSPLWIDYTR